MDGEPETPKPERQSERELYLEQSITGGLGGLVFGLAPARATLERE
jgi:hypothetical protein